MVTPETPPTRTKALMMAAIRLLLTPRATAFTTVPATRTRVSREKLDKSFSSDFSGGITADAHTHKSILMYVYVYKTYARFLCAPEDCDPAPGFGGRETGRDAK